MRQIVLDILENKGITMNPKTQIELEKRWIQLTKARERVESDCLASYDISLVNTAGGDHVE